MLSRLETMCLMSDVELPLAAVRGQLAAGIDLIIHLGRLRDKSRKVLEVTEVLGVENGEIRLSPLCRFCEKGEKDGRLEGEWTRISEIAQRYKFDMAGIPV